MIALVAGMGVALLLALALVRLFAGPTLYDRVLVLQSLVVRAAAICATIAVAWGSEAGVEAAAVLMLANFVLCTAVLKFFAARTFQAPLVRVEDGP
jgi:multicomponent Na+:H+ antiporter subunit F